MRRTGTFWIILFLVATSGCYRMRPSHGGGDITNVPPRKVNARDVLLPPGYKIEPVAQGFTFPSGIAWDDDGRLYVLETGYAYGEVWTAPRLIRVEDRKEIVRGDNNGPWNGITWHDGSFYISEGGHLGGGKILKISPDGDVKALISGLPSFGDHHTNGPVVSGGYLYFGQGTATNAGVVGKDNADFGWLKRKPDFHDIPCADVTLAGINYETENMLTDNPDDQVSTGAFVPFGETTSPGQVVKGRVPCSGAILRVPLRGGDAELVAWGLRNPFGLAIAPDGKLYTTDNAFDERGSRPVWGAGDVLWEVTEGAWYGWPDFSAGQPIASDKEFKAPTGRPLKALLQKHPGNPPEPVAILGVHSSSNGFDFSSNGDFGHEGEAFVAQFGDMAPGVGKVLGPVGFKVVRVNVANGVIRDFAVNRGNRNGPASLLKHGGLERPVAARFDPAGKALYVVDFGILKTTDEGPVPQKETGVIWKITRERR